MKKTITAVLGLALLFALALPVAACWMAPEPFTVYSEDGQRVFRFAPNEPSDLYEPSTATISLHDADGEELWRVDNFHSLAFESSFLLSDDLASFAFFFPNTAHYALEFYANGVRMATYTVDDLVGSREEGMLLSIGYPWENWEGRSFDSAANELTVVTRDGVSHVFDLATGQSPWLSSYVPIADTIAPDAAGATVGFVWTWAVIAAGVAVLIVAMAALVMLLRRRKTKNGA